jgi:hypothetical protein
MALLGIESFDWHPGGEASAAFINRGWVAGNGIPVVRDVGRFGLGYSMTNVGPGIYPSGNNQWYRPLISPPDELIVGHAFKMYSNDISEGSGMGISFKGQGSGGGSILDIVMGNLGKAEVHVGGATVLTSALGLFEFGAWNFLEARLKLNGTLNEFQLRLNTKTIWNLSSWNPWGGAGSGYTAMDAFLIQTFYAYSAGNCWWDDIYWSDTTGPAPWNTFLGNTRSIGSYSSADGSHQDSSIGGTAPAATRYQSVQNIAADDTKYVFNANADGVGKYDLYQFNPSADSATIFGVQNTLVARQDDATQMAIQPVMESSGTQINGPTLNLSQGYSGVQQISQVDPSTSVAWLAEAANAAQLGYEIVTPDV